MNFKTEKVQWIRPFLSMSYRRTNNVEINGKVAPSITCILANLLMTDPVSSSKVTPAASNPTKNRPYVTYFLIGICCFIFLWQFTLPPQLFESSVYNFGVVPASLLGSKEGYLPATMTIFTSMFMHGGWMHLIGNMLFLWIFGDNVEDSMGRIKFIIFYLLAGSCSRGYGIYCAFIFSYFQS